MRLITTLFILIFTQLLFSVAQASPRVVPIAGHHKTDKSVATDDTRQKRRQTQSAGKSAHRAGKTDQRKKDKTVKKIKVVKVVPVSHQKKVVNIAPPAHNAKRITQSGPQKQAKLVNVVRLPKSKTGKKNPAVLLVAQNRTHRPLELSPAHRQRYHKARETAMNKLMRQLGKPYQWGGTSPVTGFDCSGLVWYAYKDLVKIKIPRTANEMYHLHDAAPVKRAELEKGDLVFFRISRRATADHVGVYVGNNRFIQSPRTGKDIQISQLSEDYWQRHYVGARRVMTPTTIR